MTNTNPFDDYIGGDEFAALLAGNEQPAVSDQPAAANPCRDVPYLEALYQLRLIVADMAFDTTRLEHANRKQREYIKRLEAIIKYRRDPWNGMSSGLDMMT